MFPDSNKIFPVLQVTARHVPSRPGFKTTFPTHRESSEVQGQNAETSCRVLPALSPCALNTPLSHPRMSESSESDFSHHPGKDSDDEGSVPSSHASDMPDSLDSRKRARPPTQILGKAWVFHGLITADAALLHAESDDPEESPFPRLKSMLLAHWKTVCPLLEPRITKLILHLGFFCNLTSLLACSLDEKDASKVQIRIRAFLQSKKTAVTALRKLLPESGGFISGSWERCEGGLSGHVLYDECVQTKTVTVDDNVWMPLLKVGDFLVSNMAKHKASKVCNYIINLHIRSL